MRRSRRRAPSKADMPADLRSRATRRGDAALGRATQQARSGQAAEALRSAAIAERAYRSIDDGAAFGRALWARAVALDALHRLAERDEAGRAALELARRHGDRVGEARALNILYRSHPDIALRLQNLQQALAAAVAAADPAVEAMLCNNLALAYRAAALARRARRTGERALALRQRLGDRAGAVNVLSILAFNDLVAGDVEGARARRLAFAAAIAAGDSPESTIFLRWLDAALLVDDGEVARGLAALRNVAAELTRQDPASSFVPIACTQMSEASLALGRHAAALRDSSRAVALAEARNRSIYGGDGSDARLWWQHHRALAANGRTEAAAGALERGYLSLTASIRNLGDQGLRRNAVNKRASDRAVVRAWVELARRTGSARGLYTAHLDAPASTREPFQRLADAGLRMNEQVDVDSLCDFLVDEAVELSGADRVLLVLDDRDDGAGRIAAARLPDHESADELLHAITPWIGEARRTRAASLRHGPESASDPLDQRSCLIAPLVAGRELLGFVYADLDGLFGRFDDGDRDLIAMLASQAALALANLRFAAGLERQVAERTEALDARVGELEVIGAIQRGVAGQLDFQAIVELVGDKLREVFATGDASIAWWERESDTAHILYRYEHGVALPLPPPRKVTPDWGGYHILHKGAAGALNTRDEMLAMGITPRPGTDWCLSMATVPIVGSDRVLGFVNLQNHEREHAYGKAEVRLLQTIAASMGVALENARLVEETKEALKRQTATAEVLQVISNSVSDAKPVLDKILESCSHLIDAVGLGVLLIGDDGLLHMPAWRMEAGARGGAEWAANAEREVNQARLRAVFPIPLGGTGTAEAIARGRVLNFPDVLNGADVPEGVRAPAIATGRNYSQMMAPLMQGTRGLGAISLQRPALGGFTEKEQALLKTFADQAVIAIQNARLFNETKEALERQTATTEVLQVINASPGELPPVFSAIIERATRLCDADGGGLWLAEGDLARFSGGQANLPQAFLDFDAARNGVPVSFLLGRDPDAGSVLHIEDIQETEGYRKRVPFLVACAELGGIRTHLGVPLTEASGAVRRRVHAGPQRRRNHSRRRRSRWCSPFAEQAVIAIENARL